MTTRHSRLRGSTAFLTDETQALCDDSHGGTASDCGLILATLGTIAAATHEQCTDLEALHKLLPQLVEAR
jgi:hypothetical protein